MTTRVLIRYGGTGANTAAGALTALGAAPSIAYLATEAWKDIPSANT